MQLESCVTQIDRPVVLVEQPQTQTQNHPKMEHATEIPTEVQLPEMSISVMRSRYEDEGDIDSKFNTANNSAAEKIKPALSVDLTPKDKQDKNIKNNNCDQNIKRLLSPLERIRGRLHEKEERFKNIMKTSTRSMREFILLDGDASTAATTASTPTTLQRSPNVLQKIQEINHDEVHRQEKRRQKKTIDIDKLQSQLRSMAAALHEKEVESANLRKELVQRKSRQWKEAESRLVQAQNELSKRNTEIQQQQSHIQILETSLATQIDNCHLLQNELDVRLKTLVAYEIDLETHDVHYTTYLQEQQTLEEVALELVFDDDEEFNDEGNDDVNSNKDNKNGSKTKTVLQDLEERHGCRIQQLLSRLLGDYSSLEERYKSDRAERDKKLEQLLAENDELRSISKVLHEERNFFKISSSNEINNNNEENRSNISRDILQRISQLEMMNSSLKESERTLKTRIKELEEENYRLITLSDEEEQQQQPDDDDHDDEAIGGTVNEGQDDSLDNIEEQRRRLQYQAKTIEKLQFEVTMKDKKIGALKAQAVNHQMRNYDNSDDAKSQEDESTSTTTTTSTDDLSSSMSFLQQT